MIELSECVGKKAKASGKEMGHGKKGESLGTIGLFRSNSGILFVAGGLVLRLFLSAFLLLWRQICGNVLIAAE